jgi:excisionase family DNA binding protein
MPEAKLSGGDPKLVQLFEEYSGRLVSPSGAAGLLGVTRQTVNTLLRRGELRAFRSDGASKDRPKWVYIPLDDVYAYGERVGRRTHRT